MSCEYNQSRDFMIKYAKFYHNELNNNGIKNYLIGGALINALRDGGNFSSDDIDFAVLDCDVNSLLALIKSVSPKMHWMATSYFLRVYCFEKEDSRVEFFIFNKRHLNYYMQDPTWIHEKIYSFQMFKEKKVLLENIEFNTFYKPEIYLKSIYGDLSIKKENYDYHNGNKNFGESAIKDGCFFYAGEDNYDKIDFQYENLKIFFPKVTVKRNLLDLNCSALNVFDDCFKNVLDVTSNLFYSDFISYLKKENINFINENNF